VTGGDRRDNAKNPRWKDVFSSIGTVKLNSAGVIALQVIPEQIASDKKMGFTLRQVQLIPVM